MVRARYVPTSRILRAFLPIARLRRSSKSTRGASSPANRGYSTGSFTEVLGGPRLSGAIC